MSRFIDRVMTSVTLTLYMYFPSNRLSSSLRAGDLASKIVCLLPSNRMSADDSITHEYFSTIPKGVHSISDSKFALFIMMILYTCTFLGR